jgi:PAS domain-containing protein
MQVLASLRPVTNLVVGVDRPGGGERTWALVNAFPESDEQQQLRQVVVTFVDITERKRAEAALEVERLQFRHLFEQSPVATWLEDLTAVGLWMQHLRDQGVVDLRAFLQEQPDQLRHAASLIRVVDMNLAAVAQNAAQSKQHLLENLPQLFEAQTYQDFLAELDAIWQGQDSIEFESRGRRLDGRSLVRILRLSIPTRGGRLDLSRVVVTGTDITERRQSEEAIRQVRADLEKAGYRDHPSKEL